MSGVPSGIMRADSGDGHDDDHDHDAEYGEDEHDGGGGADANGDGGLICNIFVHQCSRTDVVSMIVSICGNHTNCSSIATRCNGNSTGCNVFRRPLCFSSSRYNPRRVIGGFQQHRV